MAQTVDLDKVAKGENVEWEENLDLSLEKLQLYKHWREDFLQWRLRSDQSSQRKTRNTWKHGDNRGESFSFEEGIVNNVECC